MGPRPQARDGPKRETEMSPEDFELFNMQWESYRDTTLVPNLYTAEGISMELWQCCGNTLQGNLINNSMANTSSETELLSKLKDITVKAPSYLVNRLNFMVMKQGATETSQQWLSRLKGKARHCDFNVPTGQTSYMDQRVKDTFILGLHNASIKSDIMEESALSDAQGEELSMDKVERLVEAKESTKRSMAEIGWSREDINKVTDYHKEKNLDRRGVSAASRAAGQDARGTIRELCKNCNNSKQDHGPTCEERHQKCPAFNRICINCKKVGHFGDKCRSNPKQPANNQAEAETGTNNQVVGQFNQVVFGGAHLGEAPTLGAHLGQGQ